MRSPGRVALPLLAVALALGACGGDDEQTLSKSAYITQADAICKDYSARQKRLGEATSVADLERLADKTKPLVEEELAKLRALREPDEVSRDANAAYDLLEQELPKFDQLVAAAKANDVARVQAVAAAADKVDKQADAKAKAIGLRTCGST